jgi:hypothetical protein
MRTPNFVVTIILEFFLSVAIGGSVGVILSLNLIPCILCAFIGFMIGTLRMIHKYDNQTPTPPPTDDF